MHNTASALIKKYKRARPRAADPVSISVAITPPGREISPPRRFSTVIVASHELFRIKCPFYDPRPSSHIASPSLTLSLSFSFSTLFGLIAPQRAIKHRERACTTPSLPNPDRTMKDTLYDGRQKEDLIVSASCFLGEGGVTFLSCVVTRVSR